MFRKFIVWRISSLRKPGQTDISVSELLTALSPSPPGPNCSKGQRPARLLPQLKEGIVPWGGQQRGDPIWPINSTLGIDGKSSEKMGSTHRNQSALALDPGDLSPCSNGFLPKEPRGVSLLDTDADGGTPAILKFNKDGGVLVQFCA